MSYSDIKELFKDAKDLATGANDIHLKSILLELQSAVFELQEENRDLRIEIHDLKNNDITSSELEYHEGVYTRGDEVYCGVCWDRDKNLSRARCISGNSSKNKVYVCDVCNKHRFSDIKK